MACEFLAEYRSVNVTRNRKKKAGQEVKGALGSSDSKLNHDATLVSLMLIRRMNEAPSRLEHLENCWFNPRTTRRAVRASAHNKHCLVNHSLAAPDEVVLSELDRLFDEEAVQIAALEAVHAVARIIGVKDLLGGQCVVVPSIGFVLAASVGELRLR